MELFACRRQGGTGMARTFAASLSFVLAICMGCASESGSGRLAREVNPGQAARQSAARDQDSRMDQLLNESFDTTATRDEKRRLGQDNLKKDNRSGVMDYER